MDDSKHYVRNYKLLKSCLTDYSNDIMKSLVKHCQSISVRELPKDITTIYIDNLNGDIVRLLCTLVTIGLINLNDNPSHYNEWFIPGFEVNHSVKYKIVFRGSIYGCRLFNLQVAKVISKLPRELISIELSNTNTYLFKVLVSRDVSDYKRDFRRIFAELRIYTKDIRSKYFRGIIESTQQLYNKRIFTFGNISKEVVKEMYLLSSSEDSLNNSHKYNPKYTLKDSKLYFTNQLLQFDDFEALFHYTLGITQELSPKVLLNLLYATPYVVIINTLGTINHPSYGNPNNHISNIEVSYKFLDGSSSDTIKLFEVDSSEDFRYIPKLKV